MSGWFNRVFGVLLPEDSKNQSHFEPIPLPEKAATPDGAFGGVYTYSCGQGKEMEERSPARVLEIVRRLVHHSEYQIPQGRDGALREIRYGDIMLITSGKGKLADYTALFAKHHIPFRVEGKILFRECPALCALVALYQAIALPNEAQYLYGALTGPLYRVSDSELMRLKAGGLVMSLFSENEKIPETEPIRDCLTELKNNYFRAQDMSPSALFGMILEQYDIFRAAGTENLEYLYYALELLREAEASGKAASPEDGAAFLENLINDEAAAERCVRLSRDQDGIHMANLHKVKGLEAPIVILAAQQKNATSPKIRIEQREEGAVGWIFEIENGPATDTYSSEKQAEATSDEEEGKRLLYVAATRAARALIIGKLMTVHETEYASSVWRSLAEHADKDIFTLLDSSLPYDPPTETVDISDLYRAGSLDLSAKGPRAQTFEVRLPSSVRLESLTASGGETEGPESEGFRTNRRKKNPVLVGTVVHRLMEMLVSSRNTLDLEAGIREIAQEYGAEDSYYTDILKQVGATVQSGGFLQETAVPRDILTELLKADEVHCEVPFCYRENEGAAIWHGVMDVLYRKEDRWHIIDYKTNSDPTDLDARYQEQMNAYTAAFKRMTGEEADALIYHINV